ncbi:MAG: Molybdate-binding protein ModA [Phycisphaerae bacterium]|nr:Molybdate-binding protein ModA [Phycisphaerae bacterium]
MRTCAASLIVAAVVAACGCQKQPQNAAQAPAAPKTRAATGTLTVFAAASTTDVLHEAGTRFEARSGSNVVFSFDASSNLARQIKAGAPADVFLSADEKWMDDVEAAGMIEAATRRDLLGNRLVLVAPVGQSFEARMSADFDFAAKCPQVKRIAVGDPTHVPAGRYAREALESLGWWKGVEERLIPAQDVRAALRLVELGEADAGIVYATDAPASQRVVVIAAFPPETHAKIRYPVARCKNAGPAAAEFLRFLASGEMNEVFEAAGFERIGAEPVGPGN